MNFIKFLLVVFFLGSCSRDDSDKVLIDFPRSLPQKFALESIVNFSNGTSATEDELPWKETLTLMPDSTFIKQRIYNLDSIISVNGTFSYEITSENKLIQMIYNTNSNLSNNCDGSVYEGLKMISQYSFSSSKAICDGPTFVYYNQ